MTRKLTVLVSCPFFFRQRKYRINCVILLTHYRSNKKGTAEFINFYFTPYILVLRSLVSLSSSFLQLTWSLVYVMSKHVNGLSNY